MSEPERLKLGRHRPDEADSAGGASGADSTFLERRRKRRAAKKRRIAAMSRRRRIARRVGILSTWFLGMIAVLMVTAIVLFYTLSRRAASAGRRAAADRDDPVLRRQRHGPHRHHRPHRRPASRSVPKQVRWDVLAAEDRNFYNEPGVSITGTLRAACNDLTGGDTQGGSGITQQYVKNAYLNSSQTLSRKLRELAIAIKLVARVLQGPDPRVLPEHRLLRPRRVRHPGRRAGLLPPRRQQARRRRRAPCSPRCCARRRTTTRPSTRARPRRAGSTWCPAWSTPTPDPAAGRRDEATRRSRRCRRTAASRSAARTRLIVARVIDELAAHGIPENEIYAKGLTIKTTIEPQGAERRDQRDPPDLRRPDQAAAQHEERAGRGPPEGRRGARLLRRTVRTQLRPPQGPVRLRRPRLRSARFVVQAVHARHGADADARQEVARQPDHDQLRRRRQLLRDDRGHQDLQRPERPSR